MCPLDHDLLRDAVQAHSRRHFLGNAGYGIGMMALANLLAGDNRAQGAEKNEPAIAGADLTLTNPLTPKQPHFAPKAKACIFIFLEGAPSQIDLFDPKPKLNELDGQPLPESMTKNVRFAFIKKESAVLMGSPRQYAKHGESGMVFSDYLPHLATCADDMLMVRSMHTDQFNHHPAQLTEPAAGPRCGRAGSCLRCMQEFCSATRGIRC
jgi:hypothetical protein